MVNKALFWLASLDFKMLGVGMVITTFVFWYALLDDGSALKKQIEALNNDLNNERAKVEDSKKAIAKADEVKKKLTSLGDKYREITTLIPSDLPFSDVLRTISTTATLTGVNIKLQEPKPAVEKDILQELPFKLLMEGTFSEVTMFLYYISSAERIMRVSNFSISLQSSANAGGLVQFEGDLIAYKFIGKAIK